MTDITQLLKDVKEQSALLESLEMLEIDTSQLAQEPGTSLLLVLGFGGILQPLYILTKCETDIFYKLYFSLTW